MKKALKNYLTYIWVLILVMIGLGTSLLPIYASMYGWFGIDYEGFVWNPDWVVLFFGAIYFLLGYVLQDLTKVATRRRTKNWAGELPLEVKERAWQRGIPFYLSALTMLLVALVMLFICIINNVDTIREVILGLTKGS